MEVLISENRLYCSSLRREKESVGNRRWEDLVRAEDLKANVRKGIKRDNVCVLVGESFSSKGRVSSEE